MSQREEQMFPQLYWDGGNRTTSDRAVKIHQGRGVGGSTLHNLNLCKRVPASIRERWSRERGLEHLSAATWDALYDEVESLLSVSDVEESRWNRHNKLLQQGCEALGWRGGGLRHNRTGCIGSGFCEVGCAYDAKNNAIKVLIPRAIKAGAQVLSHCQAIRVRHQGGKAVGVDAVSIEHPHQRPGQAVTIDAPRICLSASATATAALLKRSRVPAPEGSVGETLRIHPAVVVAGRFKEPVIAWKGIPQTYECTEYLNFDEGAQGHRVWIVPAFAHPVGTATFIPGHGEEHQRAMESYDRLAVLTAMIHDESAGSVDPKGDLGLSIDYWPNESDRGELSLGLEACAKLLFAAGAEEVLVPSQPTRSIRPGEPLGLVDMPIEAGKIDLTAVHPMASVPMGDDPKTAAVGSDGKHHHLAGLWVADGSLFPTSIGVPPQLSIYALGLHVGRALARSKI